MNKLIGYIIVSSACVWGQTQTVSPRINQLPTRQFGQPSLASPLTQGTPNLVEGRELDAPGQIAFDTTVTPPILYIADIGNSRVLAYKNSASINAGNFADLVIGQQDFVSTIPQGGSASSLTTGLNSPTGVAVDSKGNLYVVDAGNNRILRFPSPFKQPAGSTPVPDLVIGQKSFTSSVSPNEGGNCSSKSLGLANGTVYVSNLAIDLNGNLWVTDPLNYRVLMYPSVASIPGGTTEQPATVVLGQNDFTTCTFANGFTQLTKTSVYQPAGLAFDSVGNLYVSDSAARVLYYTGPNFSVGQTASRILGVSPPQQQGQQPVTYPNQYSLSGPSVASPNGVFTMGNHAFVADTGQNRIVEYDIPGNWSAETTAVPSPQIIAVVGQVGFTAGSSNQGMAQPSAFTLASPYGGAFVGSTMWVSDTGNNRVLSFQPNVTSGYLGASQVVGQLAFIYGAPNLIEGKEVFLSGLSGSASGIVVDKSSNPPHLYVADPGNNRILGFKNANTVGAGTSATFADLVIGQPDFKTSEINYPGGLAGSPTQTGLYNPIGLAVDNNGNLYVADYGNGRVVRFPAPYAQPAGQQATANLVLGQSSFTTVVQNATANSMHSPWGVALFAGSDANNTPLAGGIAVSDPVFNRVLFFKKSAGGDFTNGESASLVFGQSSFTAIASGTGIASFSQPRGIASDTSDRLYVADAANNRVLAFTQAPQSPSSGPTSTQTYAGLNAPQAVAVSSLTTELLVADTKNGQILRFPEYTNCQLFGCASTAQLIPSGALPIGLALDGSDNVIVGDAANRITFFFAQTFFRNAASFNTQGLAPGMLAVVGRYGLAMPIASGSGSATNPWATTVADLNLTVNGVLAPIYATNAAYGAIYFQVPYEAPTSGSANFIVTKVSTGAVLGVGSFQMTKANPGFFTSAANGSGAVAAINTDGTVNGPSNAAARGSNVSFYLTGLGQVPGAPADGYYPTVAAGNSPSLTTLYIQGPPAATVLYSGVGAFAGGWQINATIPLTAIPGSNVVVLTYLGFPSNKGGTTLADGISPGADGAITTTLWVK